MIDESAPFKLVQNAWKAQDYINWILPGIGIIISFILVWYLWRYIRHSNQAGRISEFDERTFQRIIKEGPEGQHTPLCPDCELPMRVETHYKDYLQDSGEFVFQRETLKPSLNQFLENGQITQKDKNRILGYFDKHSTLKEQRFRRYKCPDCGRVEVLPYNPPKKEEEPPNNQSS